jgi:hypothetical protein
MQHIAYQSIKTFAIGLVVLCLASCGVFSVRDSESPVGPATVDPLNFQRVLHGLEEELHQDYNDVFAECVYRQDGAAGPEKQAADVLTRLRTIEMQYRDIVVDWQRTEDPVLTHNLGDEVRVDNVRYEVYLNGSASDSAEFTGYADFVLVNELDWAVKAWDDYPDNPAQGLSFFNPDFAQ